MPRVPIAAGWITGNVILDRDVYGSGDSGDFGLVLGREAGRSVLAFGAHNGTGHSAAAAPALAFADFPAFVRHVLPGS